MAQGKYPGWRTMTAAQRYNARMDQLFDDAKARERAKQKAAGLPADGDELSLKNAVAVQNAAAGSAAPIADCKNG